MSLINPTCFQDPESLQTIWGVALVLLIAVMDVVPGKTIFDSPSDVDFVYNAQQHDNVKTRKFMATPIDHRLIELNQTDSWM